MSFDAFDRADPSPSVEIVRQIWVAIRNRDFDGLAALLDNRIVWTVPAMPGVPFAGTWTGREQIREFFRVVDQAQEAIKFVPDEVIAQGGKVVVIGRFENRVRATGAISRSDWSQLWTIANGRALAMTEFVDTLAVSEAYRASP